MEVTVTFNGNKTDLPRLVIISTPRQMQNKMIDGRENLYFSI